MSSYNGVHDLYDIRIAIMLGPDRIIGDLVDGVHGQFSDLCQIIIGCCWSEVRPMIRHQGVGHALFQSLGGAEALASQIAKVHDQMRRGSRPLLGSMVLGLADEYCRGGGEA